jgi:alpha-L-rhamnosidase
VAIITGIIAAVKVRTIGPGHFAFDLGVEVQGGVQLSFRPPSALQTHIVVTLRVGEELNTDGSLFFPPRTRTTPEFNWTFDGSVDYEPQTVMHHEYLEFRYGELIFRDYASVTVEHFNVSAWVTRLPADNRSGSVSTLITADPTLDAVWELCKYTTKASPLDLYADSNARQRSPGCVADDVTQMRSQYATSSELSLQRFALEQLIANGPATASDWSVLPISAVYEWTMHTGDLALALATYDRLRTHHLLLNSISNSSGTVDSFGIEALVDWPTGMRDQYETSNHSTIAAAWIYHGATTLASIARLLGNLTDAGDLEAIANRLKSAVNKLQWNGSAFCDGICKETSHTAFHSSVYALALGAAADENRLTTWTYIRGRINPPFSEAKEIPPESPPPAASADVHAPTTWPPPEPSSGVGLPCGTWPAQYALMALYDNAADRGLSALRVLTSSALNSWVSMLKQGATMTMEMWNPQEKPNLTWSHGWSASPAYIIAWYLFGIRPTLPGFAALSVRPQPGDLEQGRFTMPSLRGPVSVSFAQTTGGTTFALNMSLPATVVASVGIPLPVDGLARKGEPCLFVDGCAVPLHVSGFFAVVEQVGPGGEHQFLLAACTDPD